jgi:hypothetical protein
LPESGRPPPVSVVLSHGGEKCKGGDVVVGSSSSVLVVW